LLIAACAPAALQPVPAAIAPPQVVISTPASIKKPPYRFNSADSAFLDDVQRGCFLFFWHEVSERTGMVVDRTSTDVVSVAGVGYQLASLPVGVKHGWVSKDAAAARARLILGALAANTHNRRDGLFYHYLDPDDAGPHHGSLEHVISTIDSAILLAGIITAGEYFGGDVKSIADRLVSEVDWSAYVLRKSDKPYEVGFISLGFRPKDPDHPEGRGELLPYVWADAGDEQRLVTFLAVGADPVSHAVAPEVYYRLRRRLGSYQDTGPFVWFPWSGALFTDFFAHCWIDYAALGADDPAGLGVKHRASVDWWENSRRAVRMHQLKAIANPRSFPGFGVNAWGLSASDAPSGYAVPSLFPDPLPMPGAVPNVDYADFTPEEDWGDGTLAPYAAGSAIIFDPDRAIAALRHYQGLPGKDGQRLVWREPNGAEGVRQYGFLDAFNLGKQWVATDYVAIDEGPLLVCIENARSGFVWKLFMSSDVAKRAVGRLKLRGGNP
jgi:hypothetical protein